MTQPAKLFDLNQDAEIELYELDATPIGGQVYRFTPHDWYGLPIVWQGKIYTPYPITASGFERKANAALPRPTLVVSNIGGFISAICRSTADLIGAKLTRIQTFKKYLDAVNFGTTVDPVAVGNYTGYTAAMVVSFSRAALATYFNSSGLIVTAPPNTPRFAYSGGSPNTFLGLLIEGAATNKFKQSASLYTSWWYKFDQSLPGNAPNVLPGDVETVANGGSWVIGANLTRIGPVPGPTGVTDEGMSYRTASTSGADLSYVIPAGVLANSHPMKFAVWIRRVSGAIGGSANIVSIDDDFDGDTVVERQSDPMTGVTTTWQRFVFEYTTGPNANTIGETITLCHDFGNGGNVTLSVARPVLVDINGLDDLANIMLNDPAKAAPDGTFTAMKVVLKNPGSNALFLRQESLALTTGNTYKPSIFVNYPSGSTLTMVCDDDLNTCSVSVPAVNAWRRYAFGAFTKNSGGQDWIDFQFPAVNAFWVWGPQFEPGTVMTTFVNTPEVEATRDADVAAVNPGVNATADPNVELPREVWRVDRRSAEVPQSVTFELAAPWDVAGVRLPRRIVVQNSCMWAYRSSECGYAGGPVATIGDVPTLDTALDQCGKRVSSCKLRFGNQELPFGGYPSVGQTTARS